VEIQGHSEPALVESQTRNQGKHLVTLEHGNLAMQYSGSEALHESPPSVKHLVIITAGTSVKINL